MPRPYSGLMAVGNVDTLVCVLKYVDFSPLLGGIKNTFFYAWKHFW